MTHLALIVVSLAERARFAFQHRAAEWNICVEPERFQSSRLVVVLQARTSSGRIARGKIDPDTVEPDAIEAMCQHAVDSVIKVL